MDPKPKRPGEKHDTSGLTLMEHYAIKAEQNRKKYQTALVDNWPDLRIYDCPVFLGSFSWTCPTRGERLIYKPCAVDIGLGPMSPGEVVRGYLDWKYPNRLRASKAQLDAIKVHRSFPYLAIRGEHGAGAYVDIKAAYWSITQIVGWDVDYFPGKFLGVSSDVSDFPLQENKAARSALVTAGLPSQIRLWTGSNLVWKNGKNQHINWGLWSLVMDVLHGIAGDMMRLNPVYYHTDGCIIPLPAVTDAVSIITDWGLKASVKASGKCAVKGVGAYSVGAMKTKRQSVSPWHDSENVRPIFPDWLKQTFKRITDQRSVIR